MAESGSASSGATGGGEGQAAQAQAAATQSSEATQTAEASEGQTTENIEGEQAPEVTEKKTEAKETPEKKEQPPHKFHDRLTQYFPDREFASEEDYESAFEEYLSEHEEYRKRGDEANKQLIDFFESEPQAANVIREAMNGVPFTVALARHFDPADLSVPEDSEAYKDYAANVEARQKDLAQKRAWEAEFQKNTKESEKVVESFRKENEIAPEEMKNIMGEADRMIGELMQGKLTQETLEGILRMVRFEKAVKEAEETAELKGKNTKIAAEMAKEQPKGDGMPDLSKGGEVPENEKKEHPIDKIRQNAERNSVWEKFMK